MAPVRLRHPNGVTTLQIPVDESDYTVQDLQQEIAKVTDIQPSLQDLKSGYPPQTLTLIPELPISSLGLKAGEQLILVQKFEAEPGASTEPSSERKYSAVPELVPESSPQVVYEPPAWIDPPPGSGSGSEGPDYVELEDGLLIHRIVPDDNSCLFSAVAMIFSQDITKAPLMRQIVVDGIKEDSETYNEAILGMPQQSYIKAILKPTTWGGAIELGILANHFNTEISSIDVETGRIDHFTPYSEVSEANDQNGDRRAPSSRCILIYSGIHYDAATMAPMADAPNEWHQTVFPIVSNDALDPFLIAAKKLAAILRDKKAFTNTSTFELKCEQCGRGLVGEKDARAHAEETGHVRFGEY